MQTSRERLHCAVRACAAPCVSNAIPASILRCGLALAFFHDSVARLVDVAGLNKKQQFSNLFGIARRSDASNPACLEPISTDSDRREFSPVVGQELLGEPMGISSMPSFVDLGTRGG
jgi:hypothetical protein